MPAPTLPLADVDAVASATCDEELVALLTSGTALADSPIRCAVTDPDTAARRRLDLALRMLRSQPRSHWCRTAGDGATVVLRWPLPARGMVLLPAADDGAAGGRPTVLVLAVGRAGGAPDVWRVRWAATPRTDVADRARALLSDLWPEPAVR